MKITLITTFLLMTFSTMVHATCRRDQISFSMADPIDNNKFVIQAQSYVPKKNASIVTFILPGIAGETALDQRLARKFCRAGIHAMVLNVVKKHAPEYGLTHLHVHNDLYVRASAAVSEVIATLEKKSTRPLRFAIVGTSLGGMMSSYIAGDLAYKIVASTIIVGAGNVPGVLAYSDQAKVVAERRQRMNYFSLPDQSAYEDLLRHEVPNDPLTVAAQVPSGTMFILTGDRDSTVPTRYQYELLTSVASPRHLPLKGDHVRAILKAHLFHSKKIIRFIQAKR